MNIRLNRLICITLSVILLCAVFTGCGSNNTVEETVDTGIYGETAYETGELESGIIAENGSFSIEWDNEYKRVIFHDLKNGSIYSTTPADAIGNYDENGKTVINNPKIESAISVTYFNSTNITEDTLFSYIGAVKNGQVYSSRIENGIRVTYDFTDEEIIVPVDYTIADDCFSVSVEPSEISDNGKNYVTGVSIAPFMCGIANETTEESYLFLPDGSGAIIEPKVLSTVGISGSFPVYGGDKSRSEFLYNTYTEQCYMPVFGMKSGNNGLCGIITSAAERADINWEVGSSNLKYSSVYPFFRIRGYNLIEQPSGFNAYGAYIKVFNKNITDEKLSVSYYSFYGEDCGYNDMADIYRNYLKDTYSLEKSSGTEKQVAFEIEGGMEEKRFFCGIPYNGFTSLTTVKQAKEIIEEFEGITDSLLVRLCGFTENGLDVGEVAGGFKINSKLGDKQDITFLTEFCSEKGIELSLDFAPVSFNSSSDGYSIKKSAALFSDYEVNSISMYDTVTRNSNGIEYFLLSRSLIPSVLEKITQKTDEYGFKAVGVGTLGKINYSDFREVRTYNCDNMQEDVFKAVKELSKNKTVIMTGSNDYAACSCDYISDAPTTSSGYDIVSYDIPFYSMVFKGYVPMNSGPLNLSADTTVALLKCIEAGISPTYSIVYDFPRSVVTAKYAVIGSSNYESVKNDIKDTLSKTEEWFNSVRDKKIIGHKLISDSVRAIMYENEVTVYVNYGNKAVTVEGIELAAEDFVVIGESGI